MKSSFRGFVMCVGAASLLLTSGCDRPADAGAKPQTASVAASLSDAQIAQFRVDLLDVAFDAATAIPVDPHIKDRSRSQETVIAAWLELNQPQRALSHIDQIGDWRRGAAYADLAFHCAQHGDTDHVQGYLELAAQIAKGAEDWRRDRINVKIARTHALLGHQEQATRLEAGVADAESGKVRALNASLAGEDDFDQQISVLDKIIEAHNFDQTRNALEALAQLFGRFYDNESRRSLVQEKIEAGWGTLPVMIRIDVLLELAGFALDHHDQAKAIALADQVQEMIESGRWMPDDKVSLLGRSARVRGLAGDTERARAAADAAVALFDAERQKIVNIDRAGALRPVAEAYQSIGDAAAALGVYKKAVEEGVENPNARPRAQDLSATCCSMALRGVEPDAELWARIHHIREGLGEPW